MLVEYIFDYSKKGLVYILSIIIVIITIVHMSVDKYLLTRAYLRFLLLLPCKLEPRAADAIERETRAYMCVCVCRFGAWSVWFMSTTTASIYRFGHDRACCCPL
jgi:hypothetical protein